MRMGIHTYERIHVLLQYVTFQKSVRQAFSLKWARAGVAHQVVTSQTCKYDRHLNVYAHRSRYFPSRVTATHFLNSQSGKTGMSFLSHRTQYELFHRITLCGQCRRPLVVVRMERMSAQQGRIRGKKKKKKRSWLGWRKH